MNQPIDETDADSHFRLDRTEKIYTFGGESWIDGWRFTEYGIDFEKVAIYNLSPEQMVSFAQTMVDHLIINGHRFEVRKTGEQDQRERLVYIKE